MPNYNCDIHFVWIWNLASNTEGETQAKGVQKSGAEQDVWV